jgi:hypothetical protein
MRAKPLRMRTRYRRDRLRRERPHTFRHPRQDKAALHQPRFIKRAGRLRPGFFQPTNFLDHETHSCKGRPAQGERHRFGSGAGRFTACNS